MAAPFEGGSPEPCCPTLLDGWSAGISFAGDVVALGIVTEDDYLAIVAEPGSAPRTVRTGRTRWAWGGWIRRERAASPPTVGSSASATRKPATPAPRARWCSTQPTARSSATLVDTGSNLDPTAWSPRPGDERLLFTSELGAVRATGDLGRRGRASDATSPSISPAPRSRSDGGPTAPRSCVRHEFEGAFAAAPTGSGHRRRRRSSPTRRGDHRCGGPARRSGLVPDERQRASLARRERGRRRGPGARRRPAAERPPVSLVLVRQPARTTRAGVRRDARPATDRIPTVMSVHGGPEWYERDAFDAETQAFVDAGYAVALVNYRGSTGYGIAFREALAGNPWFPETEDVIAGLDALIAAGITDPERVAFSDGRGADASRASTKGCTPIDGRRCSRGSRRATSSPPTRRRCRRSGRTTSRCTAGRPRRPRALSRSATR